MVYKLFRILLLLPFFVSSIWSPISTGSDYGRFSDVEIGWPRKDQDLVTSLHYETNIYGRYTFEVNLNEHYQYASKINPTVGAEVVFGFDEITFPKEWLYASGNVLELVIYNSGVPNEYATQDRMSVDFDCVFNKYQEATNPKTTVTNYPYLYIKDGVFKKGTETFTINKNNYYNADCGRNFNISSFQIISDFGECSNENTFSETVAELRIYNHYEGYTIGTREYNAGRNCYYNSIMLATKIETDGKYKIFTFTNKTYYISQYNLQMFESVDDTTYFFQSNDFYMPIGFKNDDDPYEITIIVNEIGGMENNFVFRSMYYPTTENFGSCYKGRYCIYNGEAK